MDLRDRFFGKGTPEPGGLPVANIAWPNPPSFQLLFPCSLEIDPAALTGAIRDYHPELAQATAELIRIPAPPPLPEGTGGPPALVGLVGWGPHVIKVVGFEAPMPASVLDRTVKVSHYAPEYKEAAYRHVAHVRLHYAGYEGNVLEQFVALAATAAALAQFGATVTLNENAHTSIPAAALLPHEEDAGDTLRSMRSLPIPLIYAGMVVIEPEGEGIWVRTYGCSAFSLPDLVIRPLADDQGPAIFHLFSNVLAHMRETGQTFLPGDIVQAGDGLSLRVREPAPHEWFLQAEGGRLLVLEAERGEGTGKI
jgi:hypothetical protein